MKRPALILLSLSFLVLACIREDFTEPEAPGIERLEAYDPVVRFSLGTYLGDDSATKTTYAGDDQTYIVLDEVTAQKVRYERINWNVWQETNPTNPVNKPDTLRILAEEAFTKKNKTAGDYSPLDIPGRTNQTGSKDSPADAKAVGSGVTEDDELYWEQSNSPRYFYAVYPSPTGRSATYKPAMTVSAPNASNHTVTVTGAIPREQPYLKKVKNGNVVEYLPNMADAYMYAAAKIPSADAGYVKVPLRFKPLFSAIKLIVTAHDDSTKNYRLKRVDLRTDLFYGDLNQGDPERVNAPGDGTALNGTFTASFTTKANGDDKKPEYTGDVTVTSSPVLSDIADTTYKRLTIRIPETEREWLGTDTVKLTFLALPVPQEVMTVVYTFEKRDNSGNLVLGDDGKPVEVMRYLPLQKRTSEKDEFTGNGWYTLPAAHKLYVRSHVPDIQYFFDVVVQGNFPRTWKAGSTMPSGKDYYEAQDFYSVISYRDSQGVKQPLRWKVTRYKAEGASDFTPAGKPAWLHLRGDDPWTQLPPFDVTDPGTFDPWDVPQGQGSRMKNPVYKNGKLIGYSAFDSYSYTYYPAGAPDNDPRRLGWVNHGSYIHSTPDGEFKHHLNDGVAFPDSTAWTGQKNKGEAYAYDLSSHDIYGKLTAAFNGDPNTATTANCYVVSAPGWYRFPAVYGNALKNGADNTAAYNKGKAAKDGIMGAFLDHNASAIDDPWIPYTIESVDVVWDDANCMVSTRKDSGTRMDRKPFCKKIDGIQYIYFYVDDIAQGNALIAAKDDAGTIMWSWHIWAVTNPKQYLDTITLQANKTTLNPFDVTSPNILPTTTGVTRDTIKKYDPKLNGTLMSSYRDQRFWKTSDLGQHGDESVPVDPRYCDVEFTQYFKGKAVKKVVRRFFQSGVMDFSTDTPGYQWGRKDPFRPNRVNLVPTPPLGTENTHVTIREPETFYYSDNIAVPTGKRYDNLWNAGIEEKIENSYADGRNGGSKDRQVVKTIYDPSPVGFVMPNMLAFSGLNPYGPISQVKFPRAQCGEIAKEPLATYPSRYVEFYTDYDKDKTYLRKTDDPDRTILFRLQGRINGTESATGGLHNENGAYYWTSEPALFATGTFHSRSFTVDAGSYYDTRNERYITNAWSVWPVAGVPAYNHQAKWQRTHGNRIRPMVEP